MSKRNLQFLFFSSLVLFFVSLIYFTFNNENKNTFEYYSVQKYSWENNDPEAHKELLANSKLSGNFIAKDDDLANISIPFNTFNRINSGMIAFRIKEKGNKNWYYQKLFNTNNLFQNDIPYTFIIPVIRNSKNKAYYFEIESLEGTPGNAISVSNKNLFFLKYKLTKSDLTSISKLTRSIVTNAFIQISSLTINEIFISIFLLFIPFILYGSVKYKPIILHSIIKYAHILFPLLCVSSIYYLIVHYGNIQFLGMDGGELVNAGWQYHLGYFPYKDIITIVPPGFLLGAKIGFDIFGISWNSLLLFLVVFSITVFFIQAIIFMRFGINVLLSYFTSFFIQLITSVPTSMWWYNESTSVMAVLFLSSAFLFYKNAKNTFNTLIFFASTVFLSLMKPNIAVPLLVATYIVFLFVKNLRIKSIAIGISAMLTFFCFLYLIGINPFDVFYAYANGAQRLNLDFILARIPSSTIPIPDPIRTFLCSMPLIFSIFMLGDYIISNKITHLLFKRYKVYLIFILIGIATSFLGFGMNADFKMVDLPVGFIGILLLVITLKADIKERKTNNTLSLSKIILLIISFMFLLGGYGISMAVERQRMAGQPFYENLPVSSYTNHEVFFKNMSAGPVFLTTLDNMISLMDAVRRVDNDWDNKIYIGPRIDFGYAMFNVKPAKGFPLWWGEGVESGVPRGATKKLVNRFEKSDFKMIITLSGDLAFHPPEIREYLDHYYSSYKIGYLLVWVNPHNKNIIEAVSAIAEK